MSYLQFKTISLQDKDLITPYIYRYGHDSCTWAFHHTFKYKDSYAHRDGILLIRRDRYETALTRTYAMPLCQDADIQKGVEMILKDSSAYGKKAVIRNMTENAARIISEKFPHDFIVEDDRDYYEYIYNTEELATLAGRRFQQKRNLVNNVLKTYKGKIEVTPFGENFENEVNSPSAANADSSANFGSFANRNTANSPSAAIQDVLSYQAEWLAERKELATAEDLSAENDRIHLMLSHCKELEISGILVKIDGKSSGFAFGSPNSESCFDIIAEKANVQIKGIYQFINNRLAKLVQEKYRLIDMEEDIGLEGLRKSKESYNPAYLLRKFNAYEVNEKTSHLS